jgi:hypothetical protein
MTLLLSLSKSILRFAQKDGFCCGPDREIFVLHAEWALKETFNYTDEIKLGTLDGQTEVRV